MLPYIPKYNEQNCDMFYDFFSNIDSTTTNALENMSTGFKFWIFVSAKSLATTWAEHMGLTCRRRLRNVHEILVGNLNRRADVWSIGVGKEIILKLALNRVCEGI
jgi:hypothetical protein